MIIFWTLVFSVRRYVVKQHHHSYQQSCPFSDTFFMVIAPTSVTNIEFVHIYTWCGFCTRSAVSRTYAKHYKLFIKYWMLCISNQKQSSERHTALMFCVAILTWLECCNGFAISACHPRARGRSIVILNEKRLQRKR